MERISAIVLAAGESRRMGTPKMILPFRGGTIISTVINNIFASGIKNVIAVLGANRSEVLKEIETLHVKHCYNRNYRQGMLSSVKCGFIHLPDDFQAALVFPGDQPMIGPGVINIVINAYLQTGKGIVIPVFERQRGHPLLVDSKYRDEILHLEGPEGLRELALRHPDDVLEAETGDPLILKDIDTIEDYLNEQR
jgi:molybdenum cofactor cytidylyltransferase